MSQVETEGQWKPGDWVLITHVDRPLMVIGRVLQVDKYGTLVGRSLVGGHEPAIRIETVWKVDPLEFDRTTTGIWPLISHVMRYEKLGAGEATAATVNVHGETDAGV